MPRYAVFVVAAAIFLFGVATGASSQEPDPAKARADEWLQARQAEFAEYRFKRLSTKPAQLVLESRSLLNWSNPERGSGAGGLMFLWTDAGQPQMVACAFEFAGSVKHELHSLSTDPIEATRGGRAVHRFGPGIEWNDLTGAPPPAGQRGLRLVQMRRQAERFAVSIGLRDEWAAARLLPQPVFRSPADAAAGVAVFAFVQGTDPEALLLLQAATKEGWRYALTRQSKWRLKATLDERPVWEAAATHRPEVDDPQTPFLVIPQPTGSPQP